MDVDNRGPIDKVRKQASDISDQLVKTMLLKDPNAARITDLCTCILTLIALLAFSSVAAAGRNATHGTKPENSSWTRKLITFATPRALQRVPALLRLANIRLVTLWMKEKSKEDKELERRIAEIHDELIGKAAATYASSSAKAGRETQRTVEDVSAPLSERPYTNRTSPGIY